MMLQPDWFYWLIFLAISSLQQGDLISRCCPSVCLFVCLSVGPRLLIFQKKLQGPEMPFWGFRTCWGWGRVQQHFRVYSCSWITFIFFVSFNFDIWFWLNFGVIFYFLGPNGLFLALGKGSKQFWGSTYVVEQLSFCMLTNPKSESKSDLGFSLETHFPTHPPPGESR